MKPGVVTDLDQELADFSKLPGGLTGAGSGSAQAQAALLGDQRLQSAQRRALAARLGGAQGNRYLQRVIVQPIQRVPDEQASITWRNWQWTERGESYQRLRTELEQRGYRFLTKVRADSGAWEARSPEEDTPASHVGWSIGAPDGHWGWATTANVVSVCFRLTHSRPLYMGERVSRARERFYNINEPVLARVPDHFQDHEGLPSRWAGTTEAMLIGFENLRLRREGNQLIADNIPWRVSCRVTLPRWNNLLTASEADRQEWARFMRCTRIHEQGHVDLAYRYIGSLGDEMRTISGATAQEAQANLDDRAEGMRDDLYMWHAAYDDRTDHGASQGAELRPPPSWS